MRGWGGGKRTKRVRGEMCLESLPFSYILGWAKV